MQSRISRDDARRSLPSDLIELRVRSIHSLQTYFNFFSVIFEQPFSFWTCGRAKRNQRMDWFDSSIVECSFAIRLIQSKTWSLWLILIICVRWKRGGTTTRQVDWNDTLDRVRLRSCKVSGIQVRPKHSALLFWHGKIMSRLLKWNLARSLLQWARNKMCLLDCVSFFFWCSALR